MLQSEFSEQMSKQQGHKPMTIARYSDKRKYHCNNFEIVFVSISCVAKLILVKSSKVPLTAEKCCFGLSRELRSCDYNIKMLCWTDVLLRALVLLCDVALHYSLKRLAQRSRRIHISKHHSKHHRLTISTLFSPTAQVLKRHQMR
jgi:hypothetical protein